MGCIKSARGSLLALLLVVSLLAAGHLERSAGRPIAASQHQALASATLTDPYTTGQTGADVSFPQCPDPSSSQPGGIQSFPTNTGVGVVGVNYEQTYITPANPAYDMVAADGGIFSFNAPFYGSMGGTPLNAPIVGMAATPGGRGYWLVASDGGIFSFGDATFYGSMGGTPLNKPIVGMAATPDGKGYWLVAADGGIFSFGDATFYGSMGGTPLNKPVVGMAATANGAGYWLVASDGGIFSFGNATFYGSMGGTPLNKPVVGMAATTGGKGYWLVASDGGIFSFGNAQFQGSMGGTPLNKPIVGMSTDPSTGGYWLVASDGGIFSFNAPFYGSMGGTTLSAPIVGIGSFGTAFPTWSNSYAQNPCLGSEFQMAKAAGAKVSLYAVVWSPSPPSSGDAQLFTGPQAACAKTDPLSSTAAFNCQAYDWGYNIATADLSYAAAQGANSNVWWLDIEAPYKTTSAMLWGPNTTVNSNVIAGAIAAFQGAGQQVGIYSTYYQFPRIAGTTYSPGLPLWIATGDSVGNLPWYCTQPGFTFGGGTPWLIQGAPAPQTAGSNTYILDTDYAC